MPNYRRYFVAGGSYFFTVVTYQRQRLFAQSGARTILGNVIRDQINKRPFKVDAIVLLPDHLHTIWTLPSGDDKYSIRWGDIKAEFTRQWLAIGGLEHSVLPGQEREGRRGVWQSRFIEHTLQDERDFCAHVDYIHYNPTKHGHAKCPKDWPWSSFHRYVAAGDYELDWGCSSLPPPASLEVCDEELLE
jgi:putative transposase